MSNVTATMHEPTIIRASRGYEVMISPKMKLNGYFLTELDAERAIMKHKGELAMAQSKRKVKDESSKSG